MKPKMFIASSRERLALARAAQEELEHDVEGTVWNQGVFELSKSTMASLMDVLEESDFGLFILSPDDITAIRDTSNPTVRDNVIFELGLFAGRLGIERCFLVVPNGVDDLHLPSDLTGLTPAQFDPNRQDGNLIAALGPACNRVRRTVAKYGPIVQRTPPTTAEAKGDEGLISDPTDCVALIISWMGKRPMGDNTGAIRYDEVDRVLRLVPGSARQFIEKAASHWGYRAAMKGKDIILFEDSGANRF